MFREILIESSSQPKNRRRWPMATAFILQVVAVALLILVPMLTTGVIPPSARPVVLTPTYQPREAPRPSAGTSSPRIAGPAAVTRFVQIFSGNPKISYGPPATLAGPNEPGPGPDLNLGNDKGPGCSKCLEGSGGTTVVLQPPDPPQKRIRISELSEAQLIDRVMPIYPVPAQRVGIQGDVKLHALIARDGSIQSLSLISGHPLLVQAAVEAVRRWKYRPYILNGQAVEVETLITVSFKRSM
jgi:protein TonB